MAMPVPQKIVLKSSTSMSLNDRFTKIAKFAPTVQTIRVQMSNQHDVVAKNRRFAQQMSNRNLPLSPKGDILSRLGAPSILSRLGYRRGRGIAMRRGRSFRGGRGGRTAYQLMSDTMSPQVISNRGSRRAQKTIKGAMQTRDLNGDSAAYMPTPMRGQRRFIRGRGSFNATNISRVGPRRQWGARGRGRGRGGRQIKQDVTKDQLDNELDEYMANTD